MNFIAKVRVGYDQGYELQVFATDRVWLRLTRDPQRNSLGFWSEKKPVAGHWMTVAGELDGRLRDAPVDSRPAIDRACTYWPEGWDFWGPEVPAPIRSEVTSGEIEKAAAVVEASPLPRK